MRRRFGLDKTETIIISQPSIVKLNGKDIENVRKFRYLGYHLTITAEHAPL